MTRITRVVAENGEPVLWFVDGRYVGHDDQYTDVDYFPGGTNIYAVELETITVPDEWFSSNYSSCYDTLDEVKATL